MHHPAPGRAAGARQCVICLAHPHPPHLSLTQLIQRLQVVKMTWKQLRGRARLRCKIEGRQIAGSFCNAADEGVTGNCC